MQSRFYKKLSVGIVASLTLCGFFYLGAIHCFAFESGLHSHSECSAEFMSAPILFDTIDTSAAIVPTQIWALLLAIAVFALFTYFIPRPAERLVQKRDHYLLPPRHGPYQRHKFIPCLYATHGF